MLLLYFTTAVRIVDLLPAVLISVLVAGFFSKGNKNSGTNLFCGGIFMKKSTTSTTANLCAFARAHHSSFAHKKIFDDYLSFDLMGQDLFEKTGLLIQNKFKKEKFSINESLNSKKIMKELKEFIAPIPLSRIAFFEKEVKKFADRFSQIQYVICGAGFDTFAFRNDNKGIRIFEIDHPNTQALKKERISSLEWNASSISFVPVDFAKDDMNTKLLKSGFRSDLPTFFSIPGVSYYLTLPILKSTVKKIENLVEAPVEICLDFPDQTTFKRAENDRVSVLAKITEGLSEAMTGTYAFTELKEMLSQHGFYIDRHMTPEEIQEEFFSGRDDGLHAFENVHFLTANNFKENR